MSVYDRLGFPIADQPHLLAGFDPMWRSRHSPLSTDGWRFFYRCAGGCDDAWGSVPAAGGQSAIPIRCIDCAGPIELFTPASLEKEEQ